MALSGSPKTRRLNIMISESLLEWASLTASARGITVSALVRDALEKELERSKEQKIARVAEALAPLYSSDNELTAFLALDEDDFA
jgi:post-segregation antitoxin (ccd killing protein)